MPREAPRAGRAATRRRRGSCSHVGSFTFAPLRGAPRAGTASRRAWRSHLPCAAPARSRASPGPVRAPRSAALCQLSPRAGRASRSAPLAPRERHHVTAIELEHVEDHQHGFALLWRWIALEARPAVVVDNNDPAAAAGPTAYGVGGFRRPGISGGDAAPVERGEPPVPFHYRWSAGGSPTQQGRPRRPRRGGGAGGARRSAKRASRGARLPPDHGSTAPSPVDRSPREGGPPKAGGGPGRAGSIRRTGDPARRRLEARRRRVRRHPLRDRGP